MSGQPIEDRLRDLFRHQATFLDYEDTQPAEWSNDPGPEQAHRTSRRPLAVAAGLALIGAAGLGILWVRDEGPAATVTTADDEASPDIGEPDIEDPNLWWPIW